MKTVCAWCKTVMIEDNSPDAAVSHGICPDCMRGMLGDSKLILTEFLNSIEVPILVTDGQRSVQQANHAAERMLGKTVCNMKDSRIGVVIECIHAGIMGECGVSPYCAGCALRRCINDTYDDGRPRYGEYSQHKVVTKDGTKARRFRYSTSKVGDAVAIAIEGVEDLPIESEY